MAKILLIHHSPSIGGGSLSLYSLYQMLYKEHEVKIYCPRSNSGFSTFLDSKGIQSIDIGILGTISSYSGSPRIFQRTFWKGIFRIKKSKEKLKEIILNEKPDIVAVNSMVLCWAGRIIQDMGIKSICFVRETLSKSLYSYYIKNRLNYTFNAVIFISEYDKNEFKLRNTKTTIVRDCVNLDDYNLNITRSQACEILGIDETKTNILFVGGTSKLKGWEIIKRSMRQLKYDEFNLIVAGYNSRKNIKSSNIHFIGVRKDMPIVYRACDMLIFPSIKPHQARPIFESGATRIPAIVSDFKQTNENIRNLYNGLTFKPKSSRELSKAIKLLTSNSKFRQKLGENNYENTIKYHEFKLNKEIILEFINRI